MACDPGEDEEAFPVVQSLANRLAVMCSILIGCQSILERAQWGRWTQSRARGRVAFSFSQEGISSVACILGVWMIKRINGISHCGYCKDLYSVNLRTPEKKKTVSNTFIRFYCNKNWHLMGLTVFVPKEQQFPRGDPGHASFISRNS